MSSVGTVSNKVASALYSIPTPSSLSFMWNFGSLLGIYMVIQIISGICLSLWYDGSMTSAFSSVVSLMVDKNSGWLIRYIHSNGASVVFLGFYIHIARGLYYGSYKFTGVWLVGVVTYITSMVTAFLGYVLPWGQMSLWGATVITNLVSTIPYIGGDMVVWMWGGFSVSGPTLMRFYSFHFLLPMILCVMMATHVALLHETGSSNPLGLGSSEDKIYFHPLFTVKDVVGVVAVVLLFATVVFTAPDLLMDSDNYVKANPLMTPAHIQPEWYFLFAYAILRSIPSKLGGVVGLVMSVAALVVFPMIGGIRSVARFSPLVKILSLMYFLTFWILTWLGSKPVEIPYSSMGSVMTLTYFGLLGVWWLSLQSYPLRGK